jgi:hypothetical protein
MVVRQMNKIKSRDLIKKVKAKSRASGVRDSKMDDL